MSKFIFIAAGVIIGIMAYGFCVAGSMASEFEKDFCG